MSETILNFLPLTTEQQQRFDTTAQGHTQLYFGDSSYGTGADVPEDVLEQASVIIGNPPRELIRRAKSLRWLQTSSAGVNAYTAPGILPEGCLLSSASGAYGISVAEHMFAMLLSLMKRLPAYRDQQFGGVWQDLGPARTLHNARVLCVGTGDLGSTFAKYCQALGAHTIGLRRDASKAAEGIAEMHSMSRLDELLPLADVVALNVPEEPDTINLFNRSRLERMKPDAILLNGGRGTAIDCEALADVLAAGHLWGAALDVTAPEPLSADHKLWQQSRAIITPHSAGGDHLDLTLTRIVEIALDNLGRYLAGETLRNRMR